MKLHRFFGLLAAAVTLQFATAATFKLEKVGPPVPSLYERGSIAYGIGVFVLPAGQAILYSTNAGASWLDAKVNVPRLVFIKYVNGFFFAGADAGTALFISQDGTHWRSSQFSALPTDVAFGNGKFVVTGPALRAHSTDTLSWAEAMAPSPVSPATATGVMVAYGNGLFVAAEENNDGYRGIPGIDTSVDGTVWTRLNLAAIKVDPNCSASVCDTVQSLRGLVFFNGKFVAFGHSVFSAGRTGNYFLESNDGVTWTVTSTSPPNVLGATPENALTVVNGQVSGADVAFDGTTYVTTSLTRGPDLNSLVAIPTPPLKQGMSAAQSGSTVVQVGPTILYSTNNWQTFAEPTIPAGMGALKSVRFADNRFVAVGAAGTVVWAFDGFSWAKSLSNTTGDLNDVAYGNGFWVAVGANGKIIASAGHATSFGIRNSGTELPLNSVTFDGGAFVAVGASGIVLTSTDTYNWAATATTDGKDLLAITYGDHCHVATGTNGTVNVSMDAFNWTSTNIAGANVLSRVAYGNGAFFATEFGDRKGYFSANGLTWTKVDVVPYLNSLPPAPWINGVDFTGGRFLLSGEQSLLVEAWPGVTASASFDNGIFSLNLQTITNGSHTIFSTSDIGGTSWQNRGSINVTGQATWTNSTQSATMQFFRVRQD